jgi:D-alanine-D-alanine ligase
MKINAKILICYNSPISIFPVYNGKPSKEGLSSDDLSEKGFSKEINSVQKKLSKYYQHVSALAIDRNVERTIKQLNKIAPDVIFNFVEAVEGISSYEYCMAGVFQLLGFEFTGNLPVCLGNCLNKARTKNILRSLGIPTPGYITVKPKEKITENKFNLPYPVILKLLNEDASIGISEFSVVNNFTQLKKQLNFLQRTYKQEVIIEEYIDGRELNVAVLHNRTLPISEIKFKGLPDGLPKIVTYDSKWIADSIYYENTKPQCPAKLNQKIKNKIEKTALSAFEALNCRDYARVDIRLKDSVPYVVEVNPNPDISVDSGFARAASAAGISHQELLFKIANQTLIRYKELNIKKYDTENKAS